MGEESQAVSEFVQHDLDKIELARRGIRGTSSCAAADGVARNRIVTRATITESKGRYRPAHDVFSTQANTRSRVRVIAHKRNSLSAANRRFGFQECLDGTKAAHGH